ncbi:MIP18 family protein [Actinidia rufa]|uniref:MIP18 family protein n=1 Tax=Actinidia rufa TaxID=165716 RepID=A0A7J0DW91_9ERIC|nr:MIP18 family protein [Actinidia rufa]
MESLLSTLHLARSYMQAPSSKGDHAKPLVLKLVGSLCPHLGNLTFLGIIILDDNYLHGLIPREIGNLFRLQSLSLRNNSLEGLNNLSGTVPILLYNFSSINISIYGNRLNGRLPPGLGLSLPYLEGFYTASNQFYGPFPLSLANASGLAVVGMNRNAFTGHTPMNLGRLSGLQVLSFAGNLFGTNRGSLLPHLIANLSTKLTTLWLDKNLISGSIGYEIGDCLASEFTFGLADDIPEGTLPTSFAQLKGIQVLDLSRNNLSGQIPSFVGEFTSMQKLKTSCLMKGRPGTECMLPASKQIQQYEICHVLLLKSQQPNPNKKNWTAEGETTKYLEMAEANQRLPLREKAKKTLAVEMLQAKADWKEAVVVDIRVVPGTHATEAAERVAAALENLNLVDMIDECLAPSYD